MKKFGLIGYPLSHSFSKKYFSEKFEKEGITDCQYELYPIQSIKEWPELVKSVGDELVGMNVTIPYKLDIIPYLDGLSVEAHEIQAVNTVLFKDGKTKGFNTDIPGFRDSLQRFIPKQVSHALVLGHGGAAKAVLYVLTQLNIDYQIVSRKSGDRYIPYNIVSQDLLKKYKLIINTTPLGMSPNYETYPELPYEYLDASHYLFDLVYNPAKTLFLQRGEAKGAHIMNGLPMLIGQAEAAWKIWNQ